MEINFDDLLEINDNDTLTSMNYKLGLKNREIYIDGDIGDNFFQTVILPFK